MSEIKFRGQRIDNNEWVYGCLADYMRGSGKCIMPDSFFATKDFGEINENGTPKIEDTMAIGGFIPVKPETVGQYTVLKEGGIDQGSEIYFGDLVKAPSGMVLEVIWNRPEMKISLRDKDGYLYNFNVPLYTKVGNIHENPELLTN